MATLRQENAYEKSPSDFLYNAPAELAGPPYELMAESSYDETDEAITHEPSHAFSPTQDIRSDALGIYESATAPPYELMSAGSGEEAAYDQFS